MPASLIRITHNLTTVYKCQHVVNGGPRVPTRPELRDVQPGIALGSNGLNVRHSSDVVPPRHRPSVSQVLVPMSTLVSPAKRGLLHPAGRSVACGIPSLQAAYLVQHVVQIGHPREVCYRWSVDDDGTCALPHRTMSVMFDPGVAYQESRRPLRRRGRKGYITRGPLSTAEEAGSAATHQQMSVGRRR